MPKFFKPEITLGTMLQILVLIIGGIVGYNKLEWRITSLENKFIDLKENQKDSAKIHEELSRGLLILSTQEAEREKDRLRKSHSQNLQSPDEKYKYVD